jgi:hypothetical protein
MKAIKWALPLFLFSFHSWALTNSDNSSGDLMSLNYYPHLHRVEFNPRVVMSLQDNLATSNGATVAATHNTLQAFAGYGFAHRWRISLLEGFLWDSNSTTTGPAGAQVDSDSQGLSNPTVSVAWRYMELLESGISGDVSLATSPFLGPKVQGDSPTGRDGNNLNGYWSNSFSASFYWRLDFNEVGLTASVVQSSAGVTDTAANGPLHTTAVTTFSAALADRIHLGRYYFLEPSATATLPYSYDQIGDDQVSKTFSAPLSVDPTLKFGFEPDPFIVIILSLQYHTGTTTLLTNATGGEVQTTSNSLTSTLSLRHQF